MIIAALLSLKAKNHLICYSNNNLRSISTFLLVPLLGVCTSNCRWAWLWPESSERSVYLLRGWQVAACCMQQPYVLILKRYTVMSVLNIPDSSLMVGAEVAVSNRNRSGQERHSGAFAQVQLHRLHALSKQLRKDSNTKINLWYSLLQNLKENLTESFKSDYSTNHKIINWCCIC